MKQSERKAFEDRVTHEDLFRKEALLNLKLLLALGREQIREVVAAKVEELITEENGRRRNRFRITGIAASIVLLIGIGLTFLIPSEPDLDAIYSENFEPYSRGIRTLVPDHDSLWNLALDHYEDAEEKDLPKAAELFEDLLEKPSFAQAHSNEANLYLGIINLKLGRSDNALTALKQVDENATGYAEMAVWYQGLAHVQKSDKAAAIQVFSTFKNDPRWSKNWRDRAEEICEALGCD